MNVSQSNHNLKVSSQGCRGKEYKKITAQIPIEKRRKLDIKIVSFLVSRVIPVVGEGFDRDGCRPDSLE